MRAIILGNAEQEHACRQYCKKHGFNIVGVIVSDSPPGNSELLKIIEHVANKDFSVLVVSGLESLSQDFAVLLMFEWLFRREGITLYTIHGEIDTSTPKGFALFATQAMMSAKRGGRWGTGHSSVSALIKQFLLIKDRD